MELSWLSDSEYKTYCIEVLKNLQEAVQMPLRPDQVAQTTKMHEDCIGPTATKQPASQSVRQPGHRPLPLLYRRKCTRHATG